MNVVLAFSVWLHRPTGGSSAENTVPMDLFVLATLGFLFFLIGCFATCAWVIWRRSRQPPPHVKLLMELEEDETASPAKKTRPPTAAANEAWERPADWWKK